MTSTGSSHAPDRLHEAGHKCLIDADERELRNLDELVAGSERHGRVRRHSLDGDARPRKRLRSTNLLERSLEEVQRRVKVIGRFPGETSCLSLCWAVLDLVIAGARGLGLTELDQLQLVRHREERESGQPALAESA